MDAKKLVILVLVVIAILCAMALGAGVYQGKRDKSRSDRSAPGSIKALGGLFMPDHTTLDSGRLKPLTGCQLSGKQILVGLAPCTIVIDVARRSRPQQLRLAPPAAQASACFRLSSQGFQDCPPVGRDTNRIRFDREASFAVGRDSAFLRLYCQPLLNAPCVFTLK